MTDKRTPSGLLPLVRHLLICDDAQVSSLNPRKVTVYGLYTSVFLPADAIFPLGFGFAVYVLLTECRREGFGRIVISEAETGQVCYGGASHKMEVGNDPLAVHGFLFRVPQWEIPHPGVYWIELQFNGETIAYEPLLVELR